MSQCNLPTPSNHPTHSPQGKEGVQGKRPTQYRHLHTLHHRSKPVLFYFASGRSSPSHRSCCNFASLPSQTIDNGPDKPDSHTPWSHRQWCCRACRHVRPSLSPLDSFSQHLDHTWCCTVPSPSKHPTRSGWGRKLHCTPGFADSHLHSPGHHAS